MDRTELIRTFVGIPINDDVREVILRLQERFRRGLPDERLVKWERAANLHITVKFLGDTNRSALDDATTTLRQAASAHAPFEVVLGGSKGFGGQKLRVLVVELTQGAEKLRALQADVEQALEGVGFEAEGRPYSPHLTFGRVRRNRKLHRRDFQPQADAVRAVTEGVVLQVRELVLFESVLSPTGAAYSRLETILLM